MASPRELNSIFRACSKGHAEEVATFISSGIDVNAVDGDGSTPLHLAASAGHELVVRLLLAQGAHIDAPNPTMYTPLMLASIAGRLTVVKVLLSAGADLHRRNIYKARPAQQEAGAADQVRLQKLGLHEPGLELKSVTVGKSSRELAAEHGQAEVVTLLRSVATADGLAKLQRQTGYAEAAENNKATTERLTNELNNAAQRGLTDEVSQLLEAGADVDSPNVLGERPIHLAAAGGHVGVLAVLLRKKARVDARSRELERSALMIAAADGRVHVAKLLLAARARLDCVNSNGLTAFALAKASVNPEAKEIAEMLERVAEDVRNLEGLKVEVLPGYAEKKSNESSQRLANELRDAVRSGHAGVCKELLAAKADVTLASKQEEVNDGRVRWSLEGKEWTRVVLNGSSSQNGSRHGGRSSLMIQTGGSDVANAGIGGAPTPARSDLANAPAAAAAADRSEPLIHLATVRGHLSVMELLVAHQPSALEQPNHTGDTPLVVAVKQGLEAPTKLLLALGASFDDLKVSWIKDSIAQLLHLAATGSGLTWVRVGPYEPSTGTLLPWPKLAGVLENKASGGTVSLSPDGKQLVSQSALSRAQSKTGEEVAPSSTAPDEKDYLGHISMVAAGSAAVLVGTYAPEGVDGDDGAGIGDALSPTGRRLSVNPDAALNSTFEELVTLSNDELALLGVRPSQKASSYIKAGMAGYYRPQAVGMDRIKREALRGYAAEVAEKAAKEEEERLEKNASLEKAKAARTRAQLAALEKRGNAASDEAAKIGSYSMRNRRKKSLPLSNGTTLEFEEWMLGDDKGSASAAAAGGGGQWATILKTAAAQADKDQLTIINAFCGEERPLYLLSTRDSEPSKSFAKRIKRRVEWAGDHVGQVGPCFLPQEDGGHEVGIGKPPAESSTHASKHGGDKTSRSKGSRPSSRSLEGVKRQQSLDALGLLSPRMAAKAAEESSKKSYTPPAIWNSMARAALRSGGKLIQLLSLNEGLSMAQRAEMKFAEEIGLGIVTLNVASPLRDTLLSPGPLEAAFTITMDTTKPWDAVRPAAIGMSVASGKGGLSGSSSKEEVEAYLFAQLVHQYGATVSGTAQQAQLTINDAYRYVLSVNLPPGSRPFYEGRPVLEGADVDWRLDWCALPSTEANPTMEPVATVYATVLSGTQAGNILTAVPTGYWFPLPKSSDAAAAAAEEKAEELRAEAEAAELARLEALKPKKGKKKKLVAIEEEPPPPDPDAEAKAAAAATARIVEGMLTAGTGRPRPQGTMTLINKLRLKRNPTKDEAARTIQSSARGLLARKAVVVIRVSQLAKPKTLLRPGGAFSALGAFTTNSQLRSALAAKQWAKNKKARDERRQSQLPIPPNIMAPGRVTPISNASPELTATTPIEGAPPPIPPLAPAVGAFQPSRSGSRQRIRRISEEPPIPEEEEEYVS